MANHFRLILIFVFLKALTAQAQYDQFITETRHVAKSILVAAPAEKDPVSIGGVLRNDSGSDMLAVILRVDILEGWHIYSVVPPTHHYINTDFILELPGEVQPVGEWIRSESVESDEEGVFIYEKEAVFIHFLRKTGNLKPEKSIRAGIDYQCCNYSVCKPPATKTVDLKF